MKYGKVQKSKQVLPIHTEGTPFAEERITSVNHFRDVKASTNPIDRLNLNNQPSLSYRLYALYVLFVSSIDMNTSKQKPV